MQYAQAITEQDMPKTYAQQQVSHTDTARARTIDDHAHGLWSLANDLECVVQTAQNSGGGPMLFGMNDGNVSCPRQMICNGEAARRRNTAETNTTKGRSKSHTSSDNLLKV